MQKTSQVPLREKNKFHNKITIHQAVAVAGKCLSRLFISLQSGSGTFFFLVMEQKIPIKNLSSRRKVRNLQFFSACAVRSVDKVNLEWRFEAQEKAKHPQRGRRKKCCEFFKAKASLACCC